MKKFDSPLWKNYVDACNQYLKTFCEKHDYNYPDAKSSWVGGFPGGITCCGDDFVSLETIIIDIENDVEEPMFRQWYDYCLECHEIDKEPYDYDRWLKGEHLLSDAEIKNRKRIRKMESEQRITELKREINKLIDEYGF